MKKALFLFFFCLTVRAERAPISASRYEALSGEVVENYNDHGVFWDKKYRESQDFLYGKQPSSFLEASLSFLPKKAKILDVGMGEGRHAIYLSKEGFEVTGIDISLTAIKKALQYSHDENVKIKVIHASIKDHQFRANSFDAIICFYLIDREVIPLFKHWLRPNGVIIFESYTEKQKKVAEFPLNNYLEKDFLHSQELLTFFKDYQILKYEVVDTLKLHKASIVVRKTEKNEEKNTK